MSTSPAPVCFVDTETTGLDPERHEIWEVGLILPDGTEHLWQLPVDLARADPIALNIGRFHERRVVAAMTRYTNGDATWRVDTERFARLFAGLTRGLHLAGAVVSFDAERLWRLLRANGECPMWHYHLIDVEALAAGWLRGSLKPTLWEVARPPWKSDDLSRAVGVEPDDFDRHTALGDARWARALYLAVMGA